MHSVSRGLFLVLSAVLLVDEAPAGSGTGQQIRGKKLEILNPTGDESRRSLVAHAKESDTDVGPVVGNPVATGAVLRIAARGGTNTGQSFFLDPSGWSKTKNGFKYKGPTGSDGDPVRKAVLTCTSGGKASLDLTLRGRLGTQSLDIVPPNPGAEASITLTIVGGETYCVTFGGEAGGTTYDNRARQWRIVQPRNEPGCPVACCATSASTCTSDSADGEACAQLGGVLGLPGSSCDSASGKCIAQ